jgi:nucleoid-associated protein YgaU
LKGSLLCDQSPLSAPKGKIVKDLLKSFKLNENQLSNLLTAIVFILVGILLVNYFKSINKVDREQTASTATEQTDQQKLEMTVEDVVKAGLPSEYTIKDGDSLWKIAERAYGSGYEWNKIYDTNKSVIKNPSLITTGMKISLPKLEEKVVEYTVAKGDSLWKIAANQCGNGFLWTKIASDNTILNPRIIEPGLKLTVRCRE